MADDAELAAFCRREHPRLVGMLGLYLGDRWAAEELAQEVLVAVCRRWSGVRQMTAPSVWTRRVAMNLANSWIRRRVAERRARARLIAGTVAVDTPELEPDDLALRDALAQLPPRQRMAIVLRYYGDLDTHETAAAMGCAVGTVRALTSQALGTLRSSTSLSIEEVVDAN